MSSELQLDVRNLHRWRRHLVNTYEVKAGMVFIAGKTVWSMPERFRVVCILCKALYKCSALLFSIYFSMFVMTVKFEKRHVTPDWQTTQAGRRRCSAWSWRRA